MGFSVQRRIKGAKYDFRIKRMTEQNYNCFITNNKISKTLCIDDGEIQFIIPMEEIAKYFQDNIMNK